MPFSLPLGESGLPWMVDLSTANLVPDAFAALPWSRVLSRLEALENGAVANVDEGRQVGHYWLRSPTRAPSLAQAQAIGETADAVFTFAERVRSGELLADDGEPFTHFLHVGIGGSALGPLLALEALDDDAGDGLTWDVLDNTDPDGIARITNRLGGRLARCLVLVVSKSGGTKETRNAMLLVQNAMRARGIDVASRMVAVTGDGSKLHQLAQEEGWRAVFPMWDWVGGRFSVSSAVGLLPMSLAGIDARAFLDGASQMDAWARTLEPTQNPACLLAGTWHLHRERNLVVLPYSDRLMTLSRYLQQVVMESLGKRLDLDGNQVWTGLTVYGNKGSTDQHAFVQQLRDGSDDFVVLFLQVLEDGLGDTSEVEPGVNAGDYLQGFLLGTRNALTERGRPSHLLTLSRVDAFTLGGVVALFERAVGMLGELWHLNAYHQPGVEAGKKAAGQVLELSLSLRQALEDGPATLSELVSRTGGAQLDAFYVLERLVATNRVIRDGDRYRLPTARERV